MTLALGGLDRRDILGKILIRFDMLVLIEMVSIGEAAAVGWQISSDTNTKTLATCLLLLSCVFDPCEWSHVLALFT